MLNVVTRRKRAYKTAFTALSAVTLFTFHPSPEFAFLFLFIYCNFLIMLITFWVATPLSVFSQYSASLQIMLCQRNRRIHIRSGFFGSFIWRTVISWYHINHLLRSQNGPIWCCDRWKKHHNPSNWDFEILASGQCDLQCKIKERLLIRDLKPAPNENVSSENLLLYWFTPAAVSFSHCCLSSYRYLALVFVFLNLIFCNRHFWGCML